LTGAVTIRTFAQPNVLVPKEATVALGDDLIADGKTAATNLTYNVSNMFMTVDSMVSPLAYNTALRVQSGVIIVQSMGHIVRSRDRAKWSSGDEYDRPYLTECFCRYNRTVCGLYIF
jgi:hypothetical protein